MSTLGDTLRERRRTLGISLSTAEADTRIRAKMLSALEEGDHAQLPNPGYVRGYVTSYARYLDLDPTPLLAMYKAETGVGRHTSINLTPPREAVVPRGQQHAVPGRAALGVVLVVVLVSLGIWVLVRVWRGPTQVAPAPAPLAETSSSVLTGTPDATGAQKATPAPTEVGVTLIPFSLGVRVGGGGASWVRVVVDGANAYEGTLTSGQAKRFEVTEKATVKIGNPEFVTVTRDTKPLEVPSSPGLPTITVKALPRD